MKPLELAGWRPIVTALAIWFVHFMLCWAAVEIWPGEWPANQLAWGYTVLALVAMAVHFRRLRAARPTGQLSGFTYRFAQGAIAIASVAVLFSALPALVLLP